jgi:hypothetical protein
VFLHAAQAALGRREGAAHRLPRGRSAPWAAPRCTVPVRGAPPAFREKRSARRRRRQVVSITALATFPGSSGRLARDGEDTALFEGLT